jgi:hypothetical protein
MSGSVRQWTLVALAKKTSLHSTVWRHLTYWREQVTIWRDPRGLLYSHSDIVCLLIQSNCNELQPSINILIWAGWLFDHPVFVGNNLQLCIILRLPELIHLLIYSLRCLTHFLELTNTFVNFFRAARTTRRMRPFLELFSNCQMCTCTNY